MGVRNWEILENGVSNLKKWGARNNSSYLQNDLKKNQDQHCNHKGYFLFLSRHEIGTPPGKKPFPDHILGCGESE